MAVNKRIIIAIHGAGMQAGIWESLARELPCQTLSLPGHGATPLKKTDGPVLPSIEALAAWLGETLRNYPARSIVLLGHSMGALVALETAQHPAVAGLVLTGAAARMPVHPDLLKQAVAAPDAAAAMILKWGISSAHPEAVEIVRKQMQPATLANDLAACNAYQHGAAAAQAIRQPALVLAGSDDKLTKAADGNALADTIPGARFHLVSGSGHMLMVENPVEMAKEISLFMEEINS